MTDSISNLVTNMERRRIDDLARFDRMDFMLASMKQKLDSIHSKFDLLFGPVNPNFPIVDSTSNFSIEPSSVSVATHLAPTINFHHFDDISKEHEETIVVEGEIKATFQYDTNNDKRDDLNDIGQETSLAVDDTTIIDAYLVGEARGPSPISLNISCSSASKDTLIPLQKVHLPPCDNSVNFFSSMTSIYSDFYIPNSDLAATMMQASFTSTIFATPFKCSIHCCNQVHGSNVSLPSLARFCHYVFDPGTSKVDYFWSYHNFLLTASGILFTAAIMQPFLGLGDCFGSLIAFITEEKLVLWSYALQYAVGMDVSYSYIFIHQLSDMKCIYHVLVGDFVGFYFANFTGQLLKPAWFHLDSNWPIHLGGGLYFGTIEIVFIYLLYLREFPEVHMDFLIQALPFIHFCFKPCVVFQSFYVPSTMHSICLFNCLIKVHVSLVESPSLFLFFIYVFDPGAVQSFGLLLWSEFMTKKHTTYKGVSVLKQLLSKLSSCLQLKDCHEAFSVNNEDLDYHLMICLLYFTSRIYDMLMMSFGAISCVYLGQSGMRVVTIALVVGLSIASESYFNYCNTKRFNCFMFSVLQFKLIIQGARYEYYAHDLVAVVKYFYICVFEIITCFRVLFWLHVEVLDSTESNKTILKKLSTIFYFAFSMRQHQWLVKVIIHGNRYEGATLFIQDRKPWFSFNLVAWNGLDPPCRAT